LNEFQRPEFLITGEHNVSETGSITIFRWVEEDIFCQVP
jgi:hypothetical protein